MSKESGLYLCRDIYYSIEYDYHNHVYCSFFVHNNIVNTKESVKISSAKNICELDHNLHVKISVQEEKPKMILWHYQAHHKNMDSLRRSTELTINRIRDWEVLEREAIQVQ